MRNETLLREGTAGQMQGLRHYIMQSVHRKMAANVCTGLKSLGFHWVE